MARILIVEDEPGIAMALQDELGLQGYDVELAGDGEAALEMGHTGRFDAILLDVMLPKKDGFTVCRELRANGVRTPILMLTAKTQEQDAVRGFQIGADDYVNKPYRPAELRARIQALLRRSADALPDVYRFGEIEVNFTRRSVSRRGVNVPLTPLEFTLLEVFIRHRGRALARQRLIDSAWGPHTFVTDRVVDNQVANLRKKIEPDPSAPTYVLSVRGFGYRFEA
jgi:two-component system, OmpR family, alkaline phosphatase synthesis response regulator PhoP